MRQGANSWSAMRMVKNGDQGIDRLVSTSPLAFSTLCGHIGILLAWEYFLGRRIVFIFAGESHCILHKGFPILCFCHRTLRNCGITKPSMLKSGPHTR
jgi:hypothetical protein